MTAFRAQFYTKEKARYIAEIRKEIGSTSSWLKSFGCNDDHHRKCHLWAATGVCDEIQEMKKECCKACQTYDTFNSTKANY